MTDGMLKISLEEAHEIIGTQRQVLANTRYLVETLRKQVLFMRDNPDCYRSEQKVMVAQLLMYLNKIQYDLDMIDYSNVHEGHFGAQDYWDIARRIK